MNFRNRRWHTFLLSILAAALLAACSASEPREEIAKEKPQIKWTFITERTIATSPAVTADKLLVGADDGRLYAFDVETGNKLWEFETGRQIRSAPLIAEGVAYFGNHGSDLYALNVETGDEIWSFKANGSITGSPALAGGTLYFGTLQNNFYALDARTGLVNWNIDLKQDGRQVYSITSPVVLGDLVFQVSTLAVTFSSFFNAIDRQTGDIVWSLAIDGGAFAPAISGNTAFVSTRGYMADGWVYAIDLDTRQPRWVFPTEDGARARTSPSIAQGLVLFGDSEGRLTALDSDTGGVEWTYDSGSDFLTSLTVADRLVYYEDVDGAIVAVDILTGTEHWRFQSVLGGSDQADCDSNVPCGLSNAPVVHGGSVYVANPAGYLYALEVVTAASGSD